MCSFADVLHFRDMQAKYPKAFFIGCKAHEMDLAIKDLYTGKHRPGCIGDTGATGVSKVLQTAVLISNVVNGSETVKAMLQAKQQSLYQQVRCSLTALIMPLHVAHNTCNMCEHANPLPFCPECR